MVWKFTPLVNVDEESGRVILLGGLIDISEKTSKHSQSDKIKSTFDIADKDYQMLQMNFSNVKATIVNNDDKKISYECTGLNHPTILKDNKVFSLDFNQSPVKKCIFKIPKNLDLKVDATNAKFTLKKLNNNMNLSLINAKVKLLPDSLAKYFYNLQVLNGKIDTFEGSDDASAYKVTIKITNGKIQQRE